MGRVTLASMHIDGVEALLRKLGEGGDPIHARAWRTALRSAVNLGVRFVQGRAPRASGKLATTIRGRLAPGRVPLWGVVTAGRQRKGFRVGVALDAGHGKRKSGTIYQFHYAGTGQSTGGWFRDTLAAVQSGINRILSTAAQEINRDWSR
jgi:hypothetical protein